MLSSTALIQQTRCGYASQSHWHQILSKQVQRSFAGIWHDISGKRKLLQLLQSAGGLLLRTIASYKEPIPCASSLALLSKESMIVGRVQTLPTAQHELHCRSLLWLLQGERSLQWRPKAYGLHKSWSFETI